MEYTKVREVKDPQQAEGDAGIDFFIPKDFRPTSLEPGESAVIASGIKAIVPKGYALIAFNKSGIAVNRGLQVGACVVDSSYRGEIHIHLTNVSDLATHIAPHDKIIQFVLLPYIPGDLKLITTDKYDDDNTKRGSGKFGSTDKQ